jgi:hypothetical protein
MQRKSPSLKRRSTLIPCGGDNGFLISRHVRLWREIAGS